jgi:CHASE2 domain-containing sensor protein
MPFRKLEEYLSRPLVFIIKLLKLDTWWLDWISRKRNRFLLNLFWGFLIAVALHFASYTGFGQQMLNDTYDFLVTRDMLSAIQDPEAVSDAIRLVLFDEDTYEKSVSKGFWTPREKVCKTIVKALKLGASVVVADFMLDQAVPCAPEENLACLSLLREAAELAEKTGAVIILPKREKREDSDEYARQYYDLLAENNRVIKQGCTTILVNSSDNKVRHLRFLRKDTANPDTIFLSLPILASVYYWHGVKKGDEILAQTIAQMKPPNSLQHGLLIPSDGSVEDIWMYDQSPDKECLEARLKFRIVSRELVKDYGQGEDRLLDIALTPSKLLDRYHDEKLYLNKIVLIGSTYRESGDMHVTPVGEMPGIFLIANGLNLFLKGNQIREPYALRYVAEALLILILAVVFLYVPTIPAAFGLTIILLLLNTPISIWLFNKWGFFLDFWLMLAGIGLFENIVGGTEFLEDIVKKTRKNQ